MQITSQQQAVDHVLATDAFFQVEQREIRGVDYTTFITGPKTVGDLLEKCLMHGDTDFLVYERERYTFKEFHQRTHRLAAALINFYNVRSGDRVALLMRNTPEYAMLIMALASIGAVPVFLNSWWTTEELKYGFNDSGAKLTFVDEPRAKRMEPFASAAGIQCVSIRSTAMEKIGSFWDLLDQESATQRAQIEIDPDSDFAIMYTSGSSGRSKGVVLTHRSATHAIQSWLFSAKVAEILGNAPAPTIDEKGQPYQICTMMTTPFFHISATYASFLLAVWTGAKLVMLYKWDPKRAVELIAQEKVSRFACVPTMSAELLTTAHEMGHAMQTLRSIDSGGAKRPPAQLLAMAKQVPQALPGNGYGMTETGGIGINMRGSLYLDNPSGTGLLQPPLMEMRIVDDECQLLPSGEVGELLLKSPCNMRCYLNKPDATAEALRHGWLYTGDLARLDEDGMISIVDRKKDMIIRGGENISCYDVQAALHLHPDVLETAVFAIPDDRLGETVGSCVFLREGAEISAEALKAFLRAHIAAFKIPEKIWFHDARLPRNAAEKIDRLALRNEYVNSMNTLDQEETHSHVQGFNVRAVEAWITANTQNLTPPFEWVRLEGGHSNLTYRLQDRFGRKAVIRRPPLGKLLPKAHDMSREWAVISSLAPTGFPVPAAVGFCDDKDVTGALFYLMGFSQGRPLHTAVETRDWVPPDRRITLAHSFIDTLAKLHSLNPDEIGLGTLGKKEDYVGRQVKTWYRSWQSSIESAQYDDQRAHDLRDYFIAYRPEQRIARVVHGDYGFHNCLIGADATVAAVIDWEISTLGDPLADLAYTLKSWPETEADMARNPTAPTSVDGFPLRMELAQRYASKTGQNIDSLDFYIGFNLWKSAAILHGVYGRYREGQKSTKGVDMELLMARIDSSLAGAESAINRFKLRA